MLLEHPGGLIEGGQDVFLLAGGPLEVRFPFTQVELQGAGFIPQPVSGRRGWGCGRRLPRSRGGRRRDGDEKGCRQQEPPAGRRQGAA
jgi:hypothetical protein